MSVRTNPIQLTGEVEITPVRVLVGGLVHADMVTSVPAYWQKVTEMMVLSRRYRKVGRKLNYRYRHTWYCDGTGTVNGYAASNPNRVKKNHSIVSVCKFYPLYCQE